MTTPLRECISHEGGKHVKCFEEDQFQHLAQTKEIVIGLRRFSQARFHWTAIWIVVREDNAYIRS